jgi:acetolactate synthase-1/2/3 large subunit
LEGERIDTPLKGSLPAEIITRIQASERPILLVGGMATRAAWRARLADLKIPIFTTVAGKGALDESGPYSAGIFTNSGGPHAPETKLLPKADLVVGLGLRTTEILGVNHFQGAFILIDELEGRGKGLNPTVEVSVNGESFFDVLDILESKVWGDLEVAKTKNTLGETLGSETWLPASAFQIMQKTLTQSTSFLLDTGNFSTIGEHVLIAKRPHHIMGSELGRSMGIAIPVGIGASLGLQKSPMVVVVGDGGVRMYPESITVAVREKLPLLVLLMTDGYYGSIRQAAVKKGYPDHSLRLDSSCWVKAFNAFGCPSERVESLRDFEKALNGWNVDSGPLFLELKFSSDKYMSMTEGIR